MLKFLLFSKFLILQMIIVYVSVHSDLLLFFLPNFNLDFVDLNEFLYTAETLTFGITEKKERENIFEMYIPSIYKSHLSKRLKKIVKHK
jgi:hypothetical protein